MDPATGRYRPNESVTAVRIEVELGVRLTRAAPGCRADWIDRGGRSYDAVGPFAAHRFERQWARFSQQIVLHLKKADLVPVDVSQFTADQVAKVEKFVTEQGLAPRVFILGRRQWRA